MATRAEPDIEMIADAMQSSNAEAYLEPSGEVAMEFDGEYLDADGTPLDEIPEDWLFIEPETSHEAYRDMLDFATAVGDSAFRERLLGALEGRGAFRRFRHTVHGDEHERGRTWSRFQDARTESRAIEWLASVGRLTDTQAEAELESRRAILDEILRDLASLTGRR